MSQTGCDAAPIGTFRARAADMTDERASSMVPDCACSFRMAAGNAQIAHIAATFHVNAMMAQPGASGIGWTACVAVDWGVAWGFIAHTESRLGQ